MDRTRGRAGSFDKAIAALDLFALRPKPRPVIACILHAGNAAEIPALLELVRARELALVIQPLYQNFGPAPYDPDWWRTSLHFPRTPEALAAVEAELLARRSGAVPPGNR